MEPLEHCEHPLGEIIRCTEANPSGRKATALSGMLGETAFKGNAKVKATGTVVNRRARRETRRSTAGLGFGKVKDLGRPSQSVRFERLGLVPVAPLPQISVTSAPSAAYALNPIKKATLTDRWNTLADPRGGPLCTSAGNSTVVEGFLLWPFTRNDFIRPQGCPLFGHGLKKGSGRPIGEG